MTKWEGVDVQYTEAGIHRRVQAAGGQRVKSGEVLTKVARELGLVEQTLRNWMKADKKGKLGPPSGKGITAEQMELSRRAS
jgi:transposase